MDELLGTWKLEQYLMTDEQTGNVLKPFGEHPAGIISFSSDARMYAFLAPENRQAPASPMGSDEECIRLHRSMVSYAGSCTVAGDQLSVVVDLSWNQSWTGTTQVRRVAVSGNRLTLSFHAAPPGAASQSLFELIWRKVERP